MKKSGIFSQSQPKSVSESEPSGVEKAKTILFKVNSTINLICVWIFRLRKFVMAAPVVYFALKLAAYNMEHLPQ